MKKIILEKYESGEPLNLALDESIDPQEKYTREVNTLFKEKDVQDTLQKMYASVDDQAKQLLLDTVEDEFLDKFASKDGSGKKEESDGSDEDFEFDEDGKNIDSSVKPDDGSDEDDNNDNDWSTAFGKSENNVNDDQSDENSAASSNSGNPFMSVKE